MGHYFVDRIEDGVVICEDENGDEVRFPRKRIIGRVGEGDVLSRDKNGEMSVDAEATENRRREILELRKYIYGTKN